MACLFAARLARVASVTLVDSWRDAIGAIRAQGVLLEEDGQVHAAHVAAEFLGDPAPPADLAIVLVKSWQTESVAAVLSRYLKPEGVALSLQNGLGNLDILGPRVLPGTTAEGATILAPGHVRSCGRGSTHIVAPEAVAFLLQRAGFEAHACAPEKAESLIWGKLAVSCGINALTALLRVCNGELLDRPDACHLMEQAVGECAAVAHAKGIPLPFPDPVVRVKEVAHNTGQNKSSMLQDVLRGAPTECDVINGAVVREGKRWNVPTPVNETLWRLIRATVHA